MLVVVVVVIVAAGAVLLALPTSTPLAPTTGSTTVSRGADAIVASAAQADPAGFTLATSVQQPSVSSYWATLQNSDGSEANVTAIVFPSANASLAYFDSLVAGVRGLPGYTDVSAILTPFQRYGACYGYGEDVDNIAVVNGFCVKGNAFLQVHLVSGIAFSSLEEDLASIMGALYQSAT
ncbi:MAG: hypothetical protein JRN21_01170 [Nitrososphaerota archaeon]|nr:hypothetical protein [Nitrososphaerota archaeon]